MTEPQKGKAALGLLPKAVCGCYVAHFQLVPATGKFVGLVCRCCNRWFEFGHERDCIAPRLRKAKRARIYQKIKVLMGEA